MRDIVLTVLIFGLLPICLLRPWVGVLVWYWFGLMNPHRLTWDFAYSMPFAMLIGGATLAGLLMTKDRKGIPWNRELILIALLLGHVTLTTFFAWAPTVAWGQWDKVMKVIVMTFVASMLIYGQNRIRALLIVVALSIGFYGVKGGVFTLMTGGGYMVQGPEASFIGGNTFLGLAMCMVLPVVVTLARQETRRSIRRAFYAVALLMILSIIFTYSRGALLGLLAVLPLIFLRSNRRFIVLLLVIPLGLIAMTLVPDKLINRAETVRTYKEDRSAMQRIQAWIVAWNLAKDNPVTGAGFEFEYYPDDRRWLSYGDPALEKFGKTARSAHSVYFQVLGQQGFVGLGIFLGILMGTFFRLRWLKKHRPKNSEWIGEYAAGIQIGLFGYIVSGAFLSSAYFDLMYLYVALTAILYRETLPGSVPLPSRPRVPQERTGAVTLQ